MNLFIAFPLGSRALPRHNLMRIPQADEVVEDLVAAAANAAQYASGDSLIGLFQAFRPDGLPEPSLLDDYQGGEQVRARLEVVYDAVGNFSRSDSMKDAYFIVRLPPPLDPSEVTRLAKQFASGLIVLGRELCNANSDKPREFLDSVPEVRVLEGKPPKHPRADNEKAALLKYIQQELPEQMNQLFKPGTLGARLGEALYFIACDSLLRDYLRWPLMSADASTVTGGELFDAYFELWRHGIKFRIFSNDQIDFYIPRQ